MGKLECGGADVKTGSQISHLRQSILKTFFFGVCWLIPFDQSFAMYLGLINAPEEFSPIWGKPSKVIARNRFTTNNTNNNMNKARKFPLIINLALLRFSRKINTVITQSQERQIGSVNLMVFVRGTTSPTSEQPLYKKWHVFGANSEIRLKKTGDILNFKRNVQQMKQRRLINTFVTKRCLVP